MVFDVVVVVECFFRQEALFDRRGDHPNATRVAIVRPRAPRVVVVVDDVFTDDTNDDDVNVNDDDDVEDAHAHHFDESLFCVVFKTRPDVDGRASSRPTDDDKNDDVVFVRGGGTFGSLPVVVVVNVVVVVVTTISSSSSSSSSSSLLLLLLLLSSLVLLRVTLDHASFVSFLSKIFNSKP